MSEVRFKHWLRIRVRAPVTLPRSKPEPGPASHWGRPLRSQPCGKRRRGRVRLETLPYLTLTLTCRKSSVCADWPATLPYPT